MLDRSDEAIENFDKAIEIEPGNVDALSVKEDALKKSKPT